MIVGLIHSLVDKLNYYIIIEYQSIIVLPTREKKDGIINLIIINFGIRVLCRITLLNNS